MKRVSARMFFTVMWRGLRQALGWFFGLFGYKRDGKFAKYVWGLFATSAAVVMGIIAIVFVYALGDELYSRYKRQLIVAIIQTVTRTPSSVGTSISTTTLTVKDTYTTSALARNT